MPIFNAQNKIAQCRGLLLMDHPFWGFLAMSMGDPIERQDLNPPTMATDGSKLFYDINFVKTTPHDQLTAVIAHEVSHCMLNHVTRCEERNKTKWNYATDIAINEILKNEFTLPQGVLTANMFRKYGDFSDKEAEYIYNKLPDIEENDDNCGGIGDTIDDHNPWKGQANAATDKSITEQTWYERVSQASIQAQLAGKYPSNIKELVNNTLNPKLDWKLILRDTISSASKSDHTWSPANKKQLYRGFYLPSITGETINIALAIDTSGSISNDQLQMFLTELKGICEQYDDYEAHVFTCDAEVHEAFTLTPFDNMPTMVSGRGGTDFRPAMKAMKDIPAITAIVYLTDGYPNDGWPDEPEIPVIWVLTANHGNPPYGMKIVLPK